MIGVIDVKYMCNFDKGATDTQSGTKISSKKHLRMLCVIDTLHLRKHSSCLSTMALKAGLEEEEEPVVVSTSFIILSFVLPCYWFRCYSHALSTVIIVNICNHRSVLYNENITLRKYIYCGCRVWTLGLW